MVLGAVALVGFVYDLITSLGEQLRLHLTLEERRRTQEMLEQANAELERRVAERTSELVQANQLLSGALAEKTVLLKEVHHRVKNNLQVISSLLNLQSGYITDPVALEIFTESRNRVRSMALIHEKLYQSGDLARIDFEDYIRAVSGGLQSTFGGRGSRISIAVEVERIMLPVDSAVPCGLIVNELVTNCFKYAFKAGEPGEIRIGMKRLNETELQLSVSDNGIGFPKEVDFRNTESLGMQLVTTLSEQLEGTVVMKNGCGTTFEISFPENNQTKL
jgi:two-component sensor histidine kinase